MTTASATFNFTTCRRAVAQPSCESSTMLAQRLAHRPGRQRNAGRPPAASLAPTRAYAVGPETGAACGCVPRLCVRVGVWVGACARGTRGGEKSVACAWVRGLPLCAMRKCRVSDEWMRNVPGPAQPMMADPLAQFYRRLAAAPAAARWAAGSLARWSRQADGQRGRNVRRGSSGCPDSRMARLLGLRDQRRWEEGVGSWC